MLTPPAPRPADPAAPEGAAAERWLAVEAGGFGLLLPLDQAGEVFAAAPVLLPLPHTRPWLLGLSSLRGQLHTVVDLGAWLGGPPLPAGGGKLVALHPRLGSGAALAVERLVGLRSADRLQPRPQPAQPRPAFAGPLWRDETGRDWQVLRLEALVTDPCFLEIAT